MKKLLAILLLLSLNLSAAEEGLLHQWRFDQTKNGKVPAKIGNPANYSGAVQLIKENGLSRLQLKGTDSRVQVTDDFNTLVDIAQEAAETTKAIDYIKKTYKQKQLQIN